MIGNNYLLWENDTFTVKTPFNPHIPYNEGIHVLVVPKGDIKTSWEDPAVSGAAFELAANVCKVIEGLGLSPWFNLQSNGNWGLLPDAKKFFHVHIYGRNQTDSWGKPVILPELPGTYQNEPMPEHDRKLIEQALKEAL